jgi:hypothetical protein
MKSAEEIIQAIVAHGFWKERLEAAVASGKSDITGEEAGDDKRCAFGQWLYRLPAVEQESEHFKNVKTLHANFHREASRVLRFALSGHKLSAEKAMDVGGSYTIACSDLAQAMTEWKEANGK